MTCSTDVMALAVQALTGTTDAGTNVYAQRDWPTFDGTYPVLFISEAEESGDSLGRNAPQFTVVTSIAIEARVQIDPAADDASAGDALDCLERMREQIKRGLINYTPLMVILQQFSFFRSRITTDASGDQHLGRLTFEIGCEYYQGPEDFYAYPLSQVDEMHIHVDSGNVFDPGGTYPTPPFPDAVQPAPRTSGPDGRDEGYLVIPQPDNPQ